MAKAYELLTNHNLDAFLIVKLISPGQTSSVWPFDYCIEINGADRLYTQRTQLDGALEQLQRTLIQKQKQGNGEEAPGAARFSELTPYLQLLFQHA
jgi:hypothetical protein